MYCVLRNSDLSEGAVGVPPAAGDADPAAAAPVPPPRRTADRTGAEQENVTDWLKSIYDRRFLKFLNNKKQQHGKNFEMA